MKPKNSAAKNIENDFAKNGATENNSLEINHNENRHENLSGEIVFSELNLEKWSIWEPSSSKKTSHPRTLERVRILADGSRVTAKVNIGITQHGNLSVRDQKIYYILLKLWQDAGQPDHSVQFSLQKIARELGEEWGTSLRRSITRSLLQLRGVLFVWENSYFDKSSGEHLEILDTFNILSELTIARRSRKMHATTAMCQFQFHRQILRNLEENYTTPIFLATVLSFRSEIAQLLYVRLDLLMADKNHYERRSQELFEELGLDSETYRHPSARKRVLERALRELEGSAVTTGGVLSTRIEKTQDGTDYKIVIHKNFTQKPENAADDPKSVVLSQIGPDGVIATETPRKGHSGQLKAIQGEIKKGVAKSSEANSYDESEETLLVHYFYQQFHGVTLKGAVNPKELAQAMRLIEQHEFDNAMALVDYAKNEADKTNYAPASLNGIVQYESRFEAERDELKARQEKNQARREAQQRIQVAHQAQNQALVVDLLERVGQIKQSAPAAFKAFLRHIEIQRDRFLQTPVARQAKAETQLLLSREYERPAKRLELFIDFFKMGSVGEALLSLSPEGQEVTGWLQNHGEATRSLLNQYDFGLDADQLLQE